MLAGLWHRLFGPAAAPGGSPPERRQLVLDSPMQAFFQGAYFAGAPYWAENIAAVTSAVTIISRTIATLPARVYQETDRGRVERPDHAVQRLIARPDGGDGILTWPDFAEWWVAQMLTLGNGLAAIEDDGRGAPVRLRPIPFWCSNPLINPNTGRLTFHVNATNLPWWPSFSPMTISSSDCLWLRDRTDSAVLGRSALSRAPQVLDMAVAAQTFAAGMFRSGAKLSGALKHPGKLSKEAGDRLAQTWSTVHSGPASSAKIVILEEGMDFSPLAMTLEDAELLASRKFQKEEIATLFNIPLPLLNIWDHSTFTNSDTASQWFAQLCLAPICRKMESEAARVLFNDPSYHLEIDLSALMRGSFTERVAAEINMVRAGVLTPNEMRLAEGWPALPGGDKLTMQATGGRPPGTEDGAGDALPAPGATNGSGNRPNGAAVQ